MIFRKGEEAESGDSLLFPKSKLNISYNYIGKYITNNMEK